MKKLFITLLISVYTLISFAQNNVGIGTTTPDSHAALDIVSSDKGILIPRLTTTQRTSMTLNTSQTGLLVFDSTLQQFWFWDGTQWVQIGAGSSTGCNTLEEAYNCGGNGAGRTIATDYGAVEFTLSNTTNGTVGLQANTTTGTSSTPSTAISAQNSAFGGAIYGENTNSSNPYNTIEASNNSNNQYTSAVAGYYDGTAQGVGVYGNVYNSSSTGVAGIMGVNNRTNGGHGVYGQGVNGVVGETNNAGGGGIYGLNNNSTGSGSGAAVIGDGNYGIWGQTTYGPAAIFGLNTRTNGGHGVWGQGVNGVVGESSDINGYGVWGSNSATTDPGTGVAGVGVTGVAGQSTNTNLSYGIYSYDDGGIYNQLDVGGNFSAGGTKSFRIDNPNNPDNKFLVHFCAESPEVLNIYRGTTILNSNGEAVVEMPNYFDKINKNFSYSLTPVGSSAPNIFIKQKITNGKFIIAGGNPNQEIDWVVYAERNDKYLQANPQVREVEPVKTGKYAGKYVHPTLYGKSKEQGILYKPALKVLNDKPQLINTSKVKVDIKKLNNNRIKK